MTGGLRFGEWVHDIRISLRGLGRSPLMAVTIVTTVGLGIGSTAAIFSAVNAALLSPLPYPDPGRLVRIYTDSPPNRFRFSVADYLALEQQQTQFAQIAGYTDRSLAYTDGATAERIRGREVTWTFFDLLGLRPVLGRGFTASDGKPGNPPVVMVSHGFWQRRLGGRRDVIGKPIRLDGRDYALAGVLGESNGPYERAQEFFIAAQWSTPPRKGPFFITTLARLRSESARAASAAELRAINRRIFPLWRSSYQDEKATWSMLDLKQWITGDAGLTGGLALAAVGLVWLIACANASNLLIARVAARRRELAVRSALGASRSRVVRLLLAESMLLATGAAAIGIALAMSSVQLVRTLAAGYFPRTGEIAINGPVIALLGALTAASALVFGLVPALHGAGGPVDESLRSAGRSSTGSRSTRRVRRVLVGSQFVIATPLLIVAGLLLASLSRLARVDLGFDTRNLVTGGIALPAAQYREPGRTAAFWDELQRRVAALPGVTSVAFADGRPPDDVGNFNNFELEEFPTRAGGSQPVTPWVSVTPRYFELLGLRLLEGRLLDERDARAENLESIVVDRAWARRFFPNGSAIGKRLHEGGCTTCPWTSVVGVVTDVRYAGLEKPDTGSVYTPMPPSERERYLMVRTAADASSLVPVVRRTLHELDPTLPFSSAATIDDLVAGSLERPRSLSWLVGSFAAVALVLSVIGIYGVMAYYVQQHSKDIGIRLALGARASGVFRWIVGQGMTLVAGGILLGLFAAFALTRLLTNFLYGIAPTDPLTFGAVSALLLIVALGACCIPAMRASTVDPATVLRNE